MIKAVMNMWLSFKIVKLHLVKYCYPSKNQFNINY